MGPNVQQRSARLRPPGTEAAPPGAAKLLHEVSDVARLAHENAELMAALRESRRELVDARARIIGASDQARRELERDLHDGAQQRLTAIMIKLRMSEDSAAAVEQARQLE